MLGGQQHVPRIVPEPFCKFRARTVVLIKCSEMIIWLDFCRLLLYFTFCQQFQQAKTFVCQSSEEMAFSDHLCRKAVILTVLTSPMIGLSFCHGSVTFIARKTSQTKKQQHSSCKCILSCSFSCLSFPAVWNPVCFSSW